MLRALRALVREGRLVRLGYGVYGRAMLVAPLGPARCSTVPRAFSGAARQALDKLGVEWEPTEAERAYNEGRSTQVPVNPVVRVKGRFRAVSVTEIRSLCLSGRPTLERLLEVQEHFGLPGPALVEKDWYVIKALAAITAVDTGDFRLVFGGGTALSRAYRLTRRMSEDVDLKIVREKAPSRGELKKLRADITDALLAAGFSFDPKSEHHRKRCTKAATPNISCPITDRRRQGDSSARRPDRNLGLAIAARGHRETGDLVYRRSV